MQFCFSSDVSDQTQSSSTSTNTRIPSELISETSKNWNGFRIRVRESKEETTLQPLLGKGETFSEEVSDQTQSLSTSLRPLPGKDETFLDIIGGNKVYVDKIQYVETLLLDQKRCVLVTRPRRFGKSNFLQMLQAFFSGEKDAFKDTAIYKSGNTDKKNGEWKNHAVVYLDFGEIGKLEDNKPTANRFKKKLYDTLPSVSQRRTK